MNELWVFYMVWTDDPAVCLYFWLFSCRRQTSAESGNPGIVETEKREWTLDAHLLATHNEEPLFINARK